DWGLVPWAAGTHAPDEKPLGPKTYAQVFELLLRLKANLLWPAMHKVTTPFNADPANAALADRYAIIMGSSHAEPMLRNNVGEWTAPAEDFDYLKNPDGVRRYWDARVHSNARYESIWTLGMRGIHDSGMVGPKTVEERRATLERIFA
ncbi:glycosyl hydrolase 115 family protein, partial [Leclercia adecarboxylata]